MAKRFRDSFEEMLHALRAHPKVEVFETFIRPPASGAAIIAAEKLIGRPLPDDLIEFYTAHDGWSRKPKRTEAVAFRGTYICT